MDLSFKKLRKMHSSSINPVVTDHPKSPGGSKGNFFVPLNSSGQSALSSGHGMSYTMKSLGKVRVRATENTVQETQGS